jgi:hypothetical protein
MQAVIQLFIAYRLVVRDIGQIRAIAAAIIITSSIINGGMKLFGKTVSSEAVLFFQHNAMPYKTLCNFRIKFKTYSLINYFNVIQPG